MSQVILKTLVGSRAHGLASEDSDYDYRGVFVEPTIELLRLGGHPSRATWIERAPDGHATTDDTAWEVGHFLALALKCNPSILEVFAAPVVESTQEGRDLQALLPYVWHPSLVRDAFIGYGLNQRKKMLEDKDGRPGKYAYTYLRVLISGHNLLTVGTLLVNVSGHPEFSRLVRLKAWQGVSKGEVIDACGHWQDRVEKAAVACQHEPDVDRVNEYLLNLRRAQW